MNDYIKSVTSLKDDIIFNLDSSLENVQPAKEIITVAKCNLKKKK